MNPDQLQEHFDNFFADVFWELGDKYGQIEDMNVCDNLGDHLVGNVYVLFDEEESAEKAVIDLNNRWYGGTLKQFVSKSWLNLQRCQQGDPLLRSYRP